MPDVRGIVLVVDDDDDWLQALTDFLAEEGYSVVGAPDGLAALEMLSQMQPFAVVTDIHMPIMGGRQLLANIRARDARVPVIVVTAEHVPDHDASLEDAFRVIRKPVRVEDLLSALEAARAHRAAHLPLQKLWLAAGAAPRARAARTPWDKLRRLGSSICSSSAVQVVMLTIVLASSFSLLKHWRGKLA